MERGKINYINFNNNSVEKYYITEEALEELKKEYSLDEEQTLFLQNFSYEQRLNKDIIKFALDLVRVLKISTIPKETIVSFYDSIGERLPRINMYEVRELLKLVFCLSNNGYAVLKERFFSNEDKITAFEVSLHSCQRRLERKGR